MRVGAKSWLITATLFVTPLFAGVHPGGLGQSTVIDGRAVCGTNPVNLNALDGVSYSIAAVTEFAAVQATVYGGVPAPMGNNEANTPAYFGLVVTNPTGVELSVTELRVSGGSAQLFHGDLLSVKPASGWRVENKTDLIWTGTAIVPPKSALDFIARPRPNARDYYNVPLTISAVTSRGTLNSAGVYATSEVNGNSPAAGVHFMDGMVSYAGARNDGRNVLSGVAKVFTVRAQEFEGSMDIPAGSMLTIVVPPAWSGLQVLSRNAFGPPLAVVDPTDCSAGWIQIPTDQPLRDGFAEIQFSAVAPPNLGSTGLFAFDAWLEDFTIAPIQAYTRYIQEVSPPPTAGTMDGLFSPGLHLSVPSPMGHKKAGLWAVAFANPTDDPITLTSVRILDVDARQLFKSVIPRDPTVGWSLIGKTEVRWDGTLRVEPHRGVDLMALIQANGRNVNATPIEVRALDDRGQTYTSTATTRQGNYPYAGVYFQSGGQPAMYIPSVIDGESITMAVVAEETEGKNIPAGTQLVIDIPEKWHDVRASTSQSDFGAPLIVEPTTTDRGSILVPMTTNLRSRSAVFTFTVTAPTGFSLSLYSLRASLVHAGTPIESSTDAVIQIVTPTGALQIVHASPVITDPVVNQIDVQLFMSASSEVEYKLEILNSAQASWETLAVSTIDQTRREVVGSITKNAAHFLDATSHIVVRLTSNARENHLIHEDSLTFVTSEYRMIGTSRAPNTVPAGSPLVPMLSLRFTIDSDFIDVMGLTLRGVGNNPTQDISRAHVIHDVNCNGYIEAADLDVVGPLAFGASNTLTFVGGPLFRALSTQPACIIVAADISMTATVDNMFGVELPSADAIVTNLDPYPMPSTSDYPVRSVLVRITGDDLDGDGVVDSDELSQGTDPRDRDSDDDGIDDGEELVLGLAPLNTDSDGDGIWDGVETGLPALADATDQDNDGTPDIIDPNRLDATLTGTNMGVFRHDLDTNTQTDPRDADSDDDGLMDGTEDSNGNGRADHIIANGATPGSGETSPQLRDSDGDGIQDGTERALTVAETPDTDSAVVIPDLDPTSTTNPLDDDSDDDGIVDGVEDSDHNGRRDTNETDARSADSDGDALQDGTELGLTAAQGAGTDPTRFVPDLNPTSMTDPGDTDSDDDGFADGSEDANRNGRADCVLAVAAAAGYGELSATAVDTDGDGIQDGTELGLVSGVAGTAAAVFVADVDPTSTTSPLDDDIDDDGISDGQEDLNHDGAVQSVIGDDTTVGSGETDPRAPDSDSDGCLDGTEIGLVAPQANGTDPAVFRADVEPTTTTSPVDTDSDNDARPDGVEDADCDGDIDPDHTDPEPNGVQVLRNDEITSLTTRPGLATIFTATGAMSLDREGPNMTPEVGEGAAMALPGSSDDDDLYATTAGTTYIDPDTNVVSDTSRPLVFYQASSTQPLRMTKGAGGIALHF